MFGEDQKEINEEVKDAAGELTNVISGDSRRRLEEIGHRFIGAVPSVISGQGHEVKHITKGVVQFKRLNRMECFSFKEAFDRIFAGMS
jgi:chemotaxis protein CheX